MSEVVRDPDRVFRCPRCASPVIYKGRGRRPVWCSARCRVEASIERRGNRIVGVEPHVVTVVPPTKRLSQWEQDRRREIEQAVTRDTVIAMVAREPYLLMKVLAQVEDDGLEGSDSAREIVAQGLVQTARAIAPESLEPILPGAPRGHRRDGGEWATVLDELSTQLANGQLYNRDLPALDEPLSRLVERYLRRRGG